MTLLGSYQIAALKIFLHKRHVVNYSDGDFKSFLNDKTPVFCCLNSGLINLHLLGICRDIERCNCNLIPLRLRAEAVEEVGLLGR